MKINPRAIFLDLDGTLADSLPVMEFAYRAFLKEFNKVPRTDEFNHLNGPPLHKVVQILKESHELEPDLDKLMTQYVSIIDDVYSSVEPHSGAFELLSQCKKKDCTIGIVTSNSRSRTEGWLKQVKLYSMVDFIISGSDTVKGKPDPEPYIMASKKTPHHLENIVAVEDSMQGVMSALNAGLQTFHIASHTHTVFRNEAVTSISSLDQLVNELW